LESPRQNAPAKTPETAGELHLTIDASIEINQTGNGLRQEIEQILRDLNLSQNGED